MGFQELFWVKELGDDSFSTASPNTIGVTSGVSSGSSVGVGVFVFVGVSVGVDCFVGVSVGVGVFVGVGVKVGVAVAVGVGVDVDVGVGDGAKSEHFEDDFVGVWPTCQLPPAGTLAYDLSAELLAYW